MKISIVTATFNSAQTVADTLNSVSSQTHSDIEHLVIDGGSRDATADIVRAHRPAVALWVSEPDQGIYDAMNKGLARATGSIVGTLNSDDFYTAPDVLAQVAEAFRDPAIDAVWGDLCYVQQDDVDKVVRYWRSGDFRPGLFARGWNPPHPTFFVRREVYSRCGMFDLSYRMGNDIELMARILEVHGVRGRHLPRVLVTMRAGGVSNRSVSGVVTQNREILRAFRALGIAVSPTRFFGQKLLSRWKQYASRPAT